jgi:hypothetical protein
MEKEFNQGSVASVAKLEYVLLDDNIENGKESSIRNHRIWEFC